MKHRLLLIALMAMTLAACSKDNPTEESDPQLTFSFEQGTYTQVALPYRKAVIAPSGNEKPALVIYLHGGSSKGNDNTLQMSEAGVTTIGNYLLKHRISSLMIVPQCPIDKSWGGSMNKVLKALIDELAGVTIDPRRIYLLGGSMGGTGTWSMLSDYPGFFAAAMPVAGNPSGCNATNVASTPLFSVVGSADTIIDPGITSAFIGQVDLLGGITKLDVEDGWTHQTTCTEAYTDTRLAWLFAQQR